MNLNKVFIAGNLTRDPELRQTSGGQAVCSFSIATNRFYKDSSGQRQQQAEFHNIVAWGRQAEIINQYLKKGSILLVEGRLQTRNWQDQQGVKHYRTEVVADQIQLGPRTGGEPYAGADRNDSPIPSHSSSAYEPRQTQNSSAQRQDAMPIIDLADEGEEIDVKDIPF
ncbi:MAG: single-stranded DNA-binding protein [bacterium]|nr:single-stranded DNA-binding protein [bacterium]MDZ4285319.1 single-stranded DNA-binding protein [Candidatus Sungbacteria bacterium]